MTIPDDGYQDGGEPYTDEELSIIDNDEPPYVNCPMCDGIGGFMGGLGYLLWYRCLQCGIEFYTQS